MIVSLKFNQAINEGFDKFFSENKDANISISLSDARRVKDIAYALLGNVSMSGAEGDTKDALLAAARLATAMDLELAKYEPRVVKPEGEGKHEASEDEQVYNPMTAGPKGNEQDFQTAVQNRLQQTLNDFGNEPEERAQMAELKRKQEDLELHKQNIINQHLKRMSDQINAGQQTST